MKKYNITVNGTTYEVTVEEVAPAPAHTPMYSAPVMPASVPKTASATTTKGAKNVVAPMSGTILDVKVNVGQAVKKGDVICVLEAMKMENEIPCPFDGVVASVKVQKGVSVAANDLLISLN